MSENISLGVWESERQTAVDMKSSQSLEERKIEGPRDEAAPATDMSALEAVEPKRALTLSIIPGLGQFYNGERVKGVLFLGVTAANLLLLSLLFCTGSLLNFLLSAAAIFHAAPKINVEQAMEIVHTGRSVTLVYLGLILSFALYAARDAYDRAREKRQGKTVPRFAFTMPEATSGSYLFHFSIICSMVLLVIFFMSPQKPPVQTTDIVLVQEVEPPPAKKPPEPPKPKQEPKQEIKKAEPKKVEPTPPKPTRVAVAVPTKDPVADPVVQSNEPEPPAAPAQSSGSPNGTGPSGSTGSEAGGGGDGDDFDFGAYLSEVQKRIKKNWFPPRGAESLSVVLKFKVLKDGTATSIRLVRSSGIAAADDAAKTAIMNGSPFPSLPKSAGDDIDIKFTFDYNVFNGKSQ